MSLSAKGERHASRDSVSPARTTRSWTTTYASNAKNVRSRCSTLAFPAQRGLFSRITSVLPAQVI